MQQKFGKLGDKCLSELLTVWCLRSGQTRMRLESKTASCFLQTSEQFKNMHHRE